MRYQIVLWNSAGDALDRLDVYHQDGKNLSEEYHNALQAIMVRGTWVLEPGDSITFEEYE